MLPSAIPRARIWVFNYNSNYSHDAQTVRIDGLATTLLNCITDRHEDFESRKCIFIGSCFGGIVVAESLVTASHEAEGTRKRAIFDQTAGVIFLGAPLRGTVAATFAGWKNFVFGILGPNHESSSTLLKQLETNSSSLEKLVAEFGKLTVQTPTQAGMEIRCFFETRATQVLNSISRNSLIKPSEIRLVDRASACLDCHEHIPLDVRHAMINKYRGPDDPNFKLVSGRIKDIVEKIRSNRLTREEKDVMQTLSFPYQDQKDVNNRMRVPGTCEWFLNHPKFLGWRRETSANLLWVTAGPRYGKSVLSKALVDEGLLNPDNPDNTTTSVCYFFFKDDAERGSGVNALRSILHQLFQQRPYLIRHAIPYYENHGPNLSFGILWEILMKANSNSNDGPVICLLDALDECETATRESLIKRISDFHRAPNNARSKLKFIMTSRPYHELSITFEVDDLPSIHLDANEVSEEIGREISLVISHDIRRISKARHPPLDTMTQDGLIQGLKKQENRTYLWVHLMLHEISRSLESTERKLKLLLQIIPASVDDAYEKILKRATDPTQAQRVLRLILAAERPLTLKEMNVALEILERGQKCISEDDLDLDKEVHFRKKIENLCGLFVSIVDQKIYLIHQTAKDFLTNHSESSSVWSPSSWKRTFTLQASHLEALKACLLYLPLCEFQDTVLGPRDDIPLSQLAQSHPLLLYASTSWTFHFQRAGKTDDGWVEENTFQLCNTKTKRFSVWYQILKRQRRYMLLPEEKSSDLIIASYFGLASVVELLLQRSHVEVNSEDDDGRTPLSWAAEAGHEAVVKLLLATDKVDIDSKDNDGKTPLSWAAWNGHEAVVKLLLAKDKVDVNLKEDEYGQTPLSWAAEAGHEAVVKLLLATDKVDIDSKDKYGQTPLLFAAEAGHEAVFKLLLATDKVDVDSKDNDGRTPLFWAAWNGHEAIVKLLLAKDKVDVDSKDNDGRTPLSCAAEEGHEAVVKLLLEAKADVDVKDTDGQTPLSRAAANGHKAVVKLLQSEDKEGEEEV